MSSRRRLGGSIGRRLAALIPVPGAALIMAVVVTGFSGLGVYAAVGDPGVRSARLDLQRKVTLYGSDEFSGPAGTLPNPKLWSIETGGGGWGNDEKQVYTDLPANVRVDGSGHLVIEARWDADVITSARISTRQKLDFKRGMIQARIRMPSGQGLHPAFWMLGTSIDQVGYPRSGEIDIAEVIGNEPTVHAAVHGPWISASPRPDPKWKLSDELQPGAAPSDDFHIYWISKEAGSITIGMDDTAYATFTTEQLPEGGKWVQDLPFYLLLNLAVGGEWPGEVGPGALPAQMLVDWVRIYG